MKLNPNMKLNPSPNPNPNLYPHIQVDLAQLWKWAHPEMLLLVRVGRSK